MTDTGTPVRASIQSLVDKLERRREMKDGWYVYPLGLEGAHCIGAGSLFVAFLLPGRRYVLKLTSYPGQVSVQGSGVRRGVEPL